MSLEQLIKSLVSEPLLTRKDLARRYGVTVETIDDWRRDIEHEDKAKKKAAWLPKPQTYLSGHFPRWNLAALFIAENNKPQGKRK